MSQGRTIVVGITGGIAAYKAVNIVRAFVLLGDSVHVVATTAALRFVGRPTLEAISRNPVHTDLYEGVAEVRHVAIGQSADLIVVAPATANTIAKLAAGLADDLLGNTILASTAPLVIAPAMHTEMWNNPATVHNVETLRNRGVIIVGPGVGERGGGGIIIPGCACDGGSVFSPLESDCRVPGVVNDEKNQTVFVDRKRGSGGERGNGGSPIVTDAAEKLVDVHASRGIAQNVGVGGATIKGSQRGEVTLRNVVTVARIHAHGGTRGGAPARLEHVVGIIPARRDFNS